MSTILERDQLETATTLVALDHQRVEVCRTDAALSIIKPAAAWQAINVGEIWRHRELLYFLVWRDVKVRYKQTILGAAWAVLQPFAQMVVFSIFLGRVAGLQS